MKKKIKSLGRSLFTDGKNEFREKRYSDTLSGKMYKQKYLNRI